MTDYATRPFKISIDKISIAKYEIGENHVRKACDRLVEMAHHNPVKLQLKAGHRHHLQGKLNIPGSSSPLLIQAGARHSGISDYRIELNPSALGDDGLDQIRTFLDDITQVGFHRFVADGKVTRIDVALDLPNVDLEDVIIRSKGQRKHGVYTGSGGQLESAYQGSPKANGTVSYNKEDDLGETWLRIERRLKPNYLGIDLPSLANPFDKIEMVSTASIFQHLDGLVPQQFFDSVRMRGFRAVLKTLPRKQREAIIATLADPSMTSLPPLNLVWEKWPTCVLEGLGIGRPYEGPISTTKESSDPSETKKRIVGENLDRPSFD